jgi:hypothetical protein
MLEAAQPSTQTNGKAAEAAEKKPRKQRENVSRYPQAVNFSVTEAMAQSLVRMCPAGGPFNQSTYLRLLLHRGLMQDDPVYQRSIGG